MIFIRLNNLRLTSCWMPYAVVRNLQIYNAGLRGTDEASHNPSRWPSMSLLSVLVHPRRDPNVDIVIMPPTILIPGSGATSAKYFSLSSTRREALSLYREILRTCKAFHWCDEHGMPWSVRLKNEARKEFVAAKDERDPLIIARLLVTGRDCVQQIQRKFNDADRAAWSRIQRDSPNRDSFYKK